jgi:predicted RNA binding protein YcfA (HicA-like mRNA interferase family)
VARATGTGTLPGRPVGEPGPVGAIDSNPTLGYREPMTWAEVIRQLKKAGFSPVRQGKGSHVLWRHATSGQEVWLAVHTKKDAGNLGNRILREAGIK